MKRLLAVWLLVLTGTACQAQRIANDSHLSRGTQLMHDQLFESAAKEFQEALAIHPGDPRASFQYAVCLLSLGRNDEARNQFESLQKQTGGSPHITYYLGRLDLLSNDYGSAIKRFSSISRTPPFPDTGFHLGVAYISSGDLTNGIKWLEEAAKRLPRDYRVHYRLARAYSSARRERDANKEYELYRKFLNEHKNTETDVRACSDALNSQSDSAHQSCQRLFDPNDPEKLTLLGELYGDAGAFDQALDPLTRAAQLDANSYEAWHDLGLTYFRMQRYKEARSPLQNAVKLQPDAYGSVVTLGATLYMLGDDEAALPMLEHAHQLNPADAQTNAVLEKLRAERTRK
jgi:Flp pilus assembly protein TadD